MTCLPVCCDAAAPTRAGGVARPRCATRALTVNCAGPVDGWTVTCVCLCVGAGCPCGMAGAVEGVAHIWPRSSVIGAVAGATPNQART